MYTCEKSIAAKIMPEEDWIDVSARIRAIYNFGIEKSEWINNCRTARFIAAMPYLAGCEKPKETALCHVSIYYMSIDESGKEFFFHSENDDADLFSRLRPIMNFIGGDKDIIDCCMSLLALNMIKDYNEDADYDRMIGKYNPIASGVWNYESLRNTLIEKIQATITPEIEMYYDLECAGAMIWKD